VTVIFPRGTQKRRCRVAAQQLLRDRLQCGAQRCQVPVEDGVGQHRLEVVAPPADRIGDVQRDLAAGFAVQQPLGSEVGQQTVADDSAQPDRPQPCGEAEEQYRRPDSGLCGADTRLDSLDDAVDQCGIGVELLYRAPVAVERPGADGEILVDR